MANSSCCLQLSFCRSPCSEFLQQAVVGTALDLPCVRFGQLGHCCRWRSFRRAYCQLAAARAMVPVIIYPLLIPLLMAAIELTNTLLSNQRLAEDDWLWGRVLVVFDVVFTTAAALAEPILVN